jgi:hypothetical protein
MVSRQILLLSFVAVALACACSTNSSSSTACTPGASVGCTGPEGCMGYQVCDAGGGGLGPCICGEGEAGPDASSDSRGADASVEASPFEQDGGSDAADERAPTTDAPIDAPEDTAGHGTSDASGDASSGDGATDASAQQDAGVLASVCATCPSGQKMDLFGACVDATDQYWGCSDVTKETCSLLHATETCDANGECAILNCHQGWGDCNGIASDGCETDLTLPTSCGLCSVVCTGTPTPVCTSTGCAASCPPGQTNCGGSCADLTSSAVHCGGCNSACTSGVRRGESVCSNGACVEAFSCDPGYTFCAAAYNCFDTSRDPTACGPSCTYCTSGVSPNTVTTCAAGVCTYEVRCQQLRSVWSFMRVGAGLSGWALC